MISQTSEIGKISEVFSQGSPLRPRSEALPAGTWARGIGIEVRLKKINLKVRFTEAGKSVKSVLRLGSDYIILGNHP